MSGFGIDAHPVVKRMHRAAHLVYFVVVKYLHDAFLGCSYTRYVIFGENVTRINADPESSVNIEHQQWFSFWPTFILGSTTAADGWIGELGIQRVTSRYLFCTRQVAEQNIMCYIVYTVINTPVASYRPRKKKYRSRWDKLVRYSSFVIPRHGKIWLSEYSFRKLELLVRARLANVEREALSWAGSSQVLHAMIIRKEYRGIIGIQETSRIPPLRREDFFHPLTFASRDFQGK